MSIIGMNKQEVVVERAYTVLKSFLVKYGLSVLPSHTDPEGAAFYRDLEAIEASKSLSRERATLYRLQHHDVIVRCRKRYYNSHTAKCLERVKAWYRAHPDKISENNSKRRARVYGTDESFTVEDFRELCIVFGGRCAYCGRPANLVPDHMIPLSRTELGPSNSIDNIIPACESCNSSKGTKTLEEFLFYRYEVSLGPSWGEQEIVE